MSISDEATDLDCPLCLERFHDPIIINCGHTFNRLCLQKVIDKNKSLNSTLSPECPTCRCPFDTNEPLISNRSLINLIKSEPIYEWYLIDISSSEQKSHVLMFLKQVFVKRDIYRTNHIIFQTENSKIVHNNNTNFDQDLQIKSISNLEKMLQEMCVNLQQQNGVKKICLLTDGLTKHSNVTKISSDIINQRLIIHIGNKQVARTRQLADQINFQFGYFNEKTLDIYVQHFITNF